MPLPASAELVNPGVRRGPFRVALTAPVYRCPACARDQVHSLNEVRKRTPEALTHVFQAAGIPPA